METQEKTCASHCSVSASLSRTWSSGSASRNTAAWSVKGLTFGAPSHRCGESLHRDRCGTEPYLTGQLRCFQGDLDGKRGLLLEVVESEDPRFQILPDEFQLVATHGDGPQYSLDHGSWNPGSCGGPPGQLVQTLPSQRTGFNTLDNWGHKTPTQSKRIKDRKEKIKGSWPGTCIQYTRLQ